MQIVPVQSFPDRIATVNVRFLAAELAGIDAHEVVQPPAAPCDARFDEVAASKILEELLGLVSVEVGQVKGGFGRYVRALIQ